MAPVNSELCSDDIIMAETFYPHTSQKNYIAPSLIYSRCPSVYLITILNLNSVVSQSSSKSMDFLSLADH